jgi:hypothetical protein
VKLDEDRGRAPCNAVNTGYDQTTTSVLAAPALTPVSPVSGSYSIELPPASAVLLTQ